MLASDQNLNESGLSATSQRVLAMRDAVLLEWEEQVRNEVRGARRILHPILINTMPVFYDNIAEALSPNHPRSNATSNNDIAGAHGNERARMTGYEPEHIVQEYQLFRDSFSLVADAKGVELTRAQWKIVNASIDLAVQSSIKEFTSMHDTFRTRMAASLSHDMRNPLSVIVSAAHLLELGHHETRSPAMVKKILENGRRLGTMIDDMLDALSIRRGEQLPLTLMQFDMLELAREVSANLEPSQSAACSVNGASVIGHWCQDSMRRALENLILNGFKYGDGLGVHVQVEETHGRVIVSVHNEGNPIAMEQRGQIFQYLWRDVGANGKKGWGIGLPFVQDVAESHGGSVGVDSSPETGTTFLIDVPVDCRPFNKSAPNPICDISEPSSSRRAS